MHLHMSNSERMRKYVGLQNDSYEKLLSKQAVDLKEPVMRFKKILEAKNKEKEKIRSLILKEKWVDQSNRATEDARMKTIDIDVRLLKHQSEFEYFK